MSISCMGENNKRAVPVNKFHEFGKEMHLLSWIYI